MEGRLDKGVDGVGDEPAEERLVHERPPDHLSPTALNSSRLFILNHDGFG